MVLPPLHPLPSPCPFVCRRRNSSSLHLQPEEGFPCGGEERAPSPRPRRTLSHIRRAWSGAAPRTGLRIRTREAEWELTWTELCVLEGTHTHTLECAGVSCPSVHPGPCLLTTVFGGRELCSRDQREVVSCFDFGLGVGGGGLFISRMCWAGIEGLSSRALPGNQDIRRESGSPVQVSCSS